MLGQQKLLENMLMKLKIYKISISLMEFQIFIGTGNGKKLK